MIALNDSVRLIVLQFSFSNSDVIPISVKRLNQETETKEERLERKSHSSGVMVIEPTLNCSLEKFLEEIEGSGYELVDGLYKERLDGKDLRGKRKYHMVRFVFVRSRFSEISEEFMKVRKEIRKELQAFCESAMWRVRIFRNPFYKNGEEVQEFDALSINLEARSPRFLPNGQMVTVWQKDEYGRRVGDAPLPITADHLLRVVGDTISLITA